MENKNNMKVLSNNNIAEDTWRMSLYAGDRDFSFMAGTFLNIKLPGGRFLLRRPISIFSADKNNKTIDIIYKVMGEGTEYLTHTREGELLDVLGPLGTGFPIQDDSQSILLVGGGVGIPPLYELGKRLREQNKTVISVLGFKNSESVFAEEEFRSLGDTHICTDDGSAGFRGNTLDFLKDHEIDFDCLYSCGPLPMLKGLDEKYKDIKKGYLSFEERMACGIGACYGCMKETKDGLKRVCKDGPVFRLGEVIYG